MTPIELEIQRIKQDKDEFLAWIDSEIDELHGSKQPASEHKLAFPPDWLSFVVVAAIAGGIGVLAGISLF